MEIKQLRYFVKVAELSSVGKASDFLNIAQPTLSRQIRALELELKSNLFSRDGRGVQLTVHGRRFLEHARGILHAADTAMDALNEGKSVYEGKVVAGMTPSIGRRIIPDYVERFTERFPKASLSVVEGYSQALAEQVVMGKLDFAIALNPSASPNLVIDPVGAEVLYLIGSKPVGDDAENVKLSDLAGLPLIMPHTIHTIRPLLEYEAARLGAMLNIALEIDSVRSIAELVQNGRGYTVMPRNSMLGGESRGLHWQKIVNPEIEVTICLIRPVRRPQTALLLEAAALTRALLSEIVEPVADFRSERSRTTSVAISGSVGSRVARHFIESGRTSSPTGALAIGSAPPTAKTVGRP
jgi:LysR family nitrogen assimilation transcriptional regulator